MKAKDPYFLGISGGSASGKTYLLNRLLQRYQPGDITLVSIDNYYIPREQLPRDEDGEINYDHPSALNLDQLAKDLDKIAGGETVVLPEYTFNNPNVDPVMIELAPAPIILVEGLFVFYHPDVVKRLNLRVFVEAQDHIRLSRRIRRDGKERGYPVEEVLDMYLKYVAPMYKQYVEPFKHDCDLIIPNNDHMENAVEVLANHLDKVLSKS